MFVITIFSVSRGSAIGFEVGLLIALPSIPTANCDSTKRVNRGESHAGGAECRSADDGRHYRTLSKENVQREGGLRECHAGPVGCEEGTAALQDPLRLGLFWSGTRRSSKRGTVFLFSRTSGRVGRDRNLPPWGLYGEGLLGFRFLHCPRLSCQRTMHKVVFSCFDCVDWYFVMVVWISVMSPTEFRFYSPCGPRSVKFSSFWPNQCVLLLFLMFSIECNGLRSVETGCQGPGRSGRQNHPIQDGYSEPRNATHRHGHSCVESILPNFRFSFAFPCVLQMFLFRRNSSSSWILFLAFCAGISGRSPPEPAECQKGDWGGEFEEDSRSCGAPNDGRQNTKYLFVFVNKSTGELSVDSLVLDDMSDWHLVWLIDCLIDWSFDWLTGRLIDWLVVWLIDWSVAWLIDWLVVRLIDWSVAWLIDRSLDWLIDWTSYFFKKIIFWNWNWNLFCYLRYFIRHFS